MTVNLFRLLLLFNSSFFTNLIKECSAFSSASFQRRSFQSSRLQVGTSFDDHVYTRISGVLIKIFTVTSFNLNKKNYLIYTLHSQNNDTRFHFCQALATNFQSHRTKQTHKALKKKNSSISILLIMTIPTPSLWNGYY